MEGLERKKTDGKYSLIVCAKQQASILKGTAQISTATIIGNNSNNTIF